MEDEIVEYAKPYCLHCYAPLAVSQSASAWCGTCGKSNLRVDLEQLWTSERRFRELEDLLKVIVVLSMLGFCAFAVFVLGLHDHRAMPMAIFVPGVIGVLLWDLACITRKAGTYRWDLIAAGIGWVIGPLWLIITLVAGFERPPRDRIAWGGLFAMGLFVCVTTIGAPWIRRRWMGWRDRHVAERQAALREQPAG